jgi:hypothetical protein
VQILVVVANIQVRTLKAEVEKGFARTAFDRESVDPEAQINLVNSIIGPKGQLSWV